MCLWYTNVFSLSHRPALLHKLQYSMTSSSTDTATADESTMTFAVSQNLILTSAMPVEKHKMVWNSNRKKIMFSILNQSPKKHWKWHLCIFVLDSLVLKRHSLRAQSSSQHPHHHQQAGINYKWPIINTNKAINVTSIPTVSALITDPQQSKTKLNLSHCANTHVILNPYGSSKNEVPPPGVPEWSAMTVNPRSFYILNSPFQSRLRQKINKLEACMPVALIAIFKKTFKVKSTIKTWTKHMIMCQSVTCVSVYNVT